MFILAKAFFENVTLHAGVMPWPFSAISLRPLKGMGPETALKMAKARGYISEDEDLETSPFYELIYECLLNG